MCSPPTTPSDPSRPTCREAIALYVAMLLTLLVLRGVVARPAGVPVRNMDEQLMFAVSVSSLTGGPANTIGWPGGSMRVATTLLVPSVFAVEHRDAILHRRRDVPAEFVRFLGRELREPWRMVGLLRWVAIVASSAGFALLPLILRRATRSNVVAFALALAALSGGTLWVRSVMPTGDAVGWATAIVGLWAALRARESAVRWTHWTIAAALSAGLATGSKLTAIYCWPLLFAASIRSRRTFALTIAIWAIAAPLGHYLLNPYVVTDPVRFAKAVAGNVLTRGANTPLATSLAEGVPVALVVGGLAALPAACTRRYAWLVFATVATLAMYAVTLRGAAMIEPHYLTPLTFPLTILLCAGVEWLSARQLLASARSLASVAASLFAVAGVAIGARATRDASRRAAEKYGPGVAAVAALRDAGFVGRIAVQPSQSYHDLFLGSIECDASIATRLARMEAQSVGARSTIATLARSGLDPVVAAGLADAFNDSDRMKIANYRAMAVAGVSTGPTAVPVRAGFGPADADAMTVDQAVAAFRAGDVDALLLNAPADSLDGGRDFGGLPGAHSVLYLRDPSTTRPSER